MQRLSLILGVFTLYAVLWGRDASAGSIDFESFSVGDGLATVNTGVAALGVDFDAIYPATFAVVVDPIDASNQGIRSQTLPSNADILINFATPQAFVRVRYLDNPEGVERISATGYDHIGTATTIQGSGGVVGSDSGFEPGTLLVTGSGIRSVQFESASGYIWIDDIEWGRTTPIPEPTTVATLGLGVGLLAWRVRRRRTKAKKAAK